MGGEFLFRVRGCSGISDDGYLIVTMLKANELYILIMICEWHLKDVIKVRALCLQLSLSTN